MTATPDQTGALAYFNKMALKFGWTSAADITTTGHSKGGNLAVYVAVLRPDLVGKAFSLDGQGFDDAFILKYQAVIDKLTAAGAIQTYANSMDFVNILFNAIGQVTYITAPSAADTGGFAYNHSPFAVFDDQGGVLGFRPVAPQDPNMAMADRLVSYVQKFMSAADFTLLCQTAVKLAASRKGDKILGIGDVIDVSRLSANAAAALSGIVTGVGGGGGATALWPISAALGLILGPLARLASIDSWAVVSSALKEPYKAMLDDLWVLLGNFVIENGVDDPDALKALLDTLFPGLWQGAVVDFGADKLLGDLQNVDVLPYSAVIRDFSEAVENELLQLADQVAPHGFVEWWKDLFSDLFARPPELDFDADDNARRAYYQAIMDMRDVSQDQIRQIFEAVRNEDRSFSVTVLGVKEDADAALQQLNELLAKVQDAVTAAAG